MEWTMLADENDYRRLSIEAPWGELAEEYRDLIARYATVARLPGFRQGKAPREAVEQRCRAEILANLSAHAVQRLGREAAREAGIEALGPLEASEIECENGKLFRARLRYLPMPEFPLPELAHLETEDDGTDAKDRISRRLLDLVHFEIPGALIRQELVVDGLEGSAPGSDAWIAADERIRLLVVLKKIARQEGIEVDGTDIDRRIAEKAEQFGTTKRTLQAEIEKGDSTARLHDMLVAERTLEYLIEMNHE